uniref:Uncharacterized protein n=2 Tax=Anguilla anguilla TaxID=7936 RepID=A0A0E9TG26_ANGAN
MYWPDRASPEKSSQHWVMFMDHRFHCMQRICEKVLNMTAFCYIILVCPKMILP